MRRRPVGLPVWGPDCSHYWRCLGAALADGDTLKLAVDGKLPIEVGINSVWVLVAGILVMFMQAGFAFLEVGFSRGKNAGTVVAKIL